MSGEKTEPPSHKKLADSRRKGDVAHSKDFTQTLLTVTLFGYLLFGSRNIFLQLETLALLPPTLLTQPFTTAIAILGKAAGTTAVSIVLPFVMIVIGVGIFGEMIQIGVIFAFEKLKPSAKKLNVIANLKNIFSKKNGVEFLKSVLKITFLSVLVWKVIAAALPELFTLPRSGVEGVFTAVGGLMTTLLANIAVAYTIIGLADFVWQRYQHHSGLKMSKQEVKQEYKESEGDPHVKGMRRQLQKEMAMQGAVQKVRRSTVLVTNPTHIAVALYYDKGSTPLPIVLAKGEGTLAEMMMREARDAGVPIMQNIPLARGLFADADVEQYIPDAFIEAVAALLQLVQAMATDEEAR